MSASPRTPNNEDEGPLFGYKPEEFGRFNKRPCSSASCLTDMPLCPDFSSYVNFDDLSVPASTFPGSHGFTAVAQHSQAFSAYRQQDTTLFDTPYSSTPNDEDIVPAETPALIADDDLFASPLWGQLSLFPTTNVPAPPAPTVSPVDLSLPLDLVSAIAAASESSKLRNGNGKRALSPPLIPVNSPAPLDTSTSAPLPKRRRQTSTPASAAQPSFTGTRNSAIPLLDETAPIQSRTYTGPASKTSRRKVPAAAAKKVAALKALAENEGVDVSEEIEMSIEEKRKQNTIAARRSRQRKAEHLAELEETIRSLREQVEAGEREKDVWMRRAYAAGWTDASRADATF